MLVFIIFGVGVYYCNLKKGFFFFVGGGLIVMIFLYMLFVLKLNLIDFIYDKEVIVRKSEGVVREIIDKWNSYYMVRSIIIFLVFVGYVLYFFSGYKKFW